MPATLKALIVPIIIQIVGIVMHARGATLNDSTSAQISQLAGALCDAAAWIIGYFQMLHNKNAAGVAQNAADIQTHAQAIVDDRPALAATTINPTIKSLFLLLGIGILLGSVGCTQQQWQNNPVATIANTSAAPADRIAAARVVYNSAMQVLILARQDKAIDDVTWHKIVLTSNAFIAAVDSLSTQTSAGIPLDGNAVWQAANAALNTLLNVKGTTNGAGSNPSSYGGPSDLRGFASRWREDDGPAAAERCRLVA